jgi:hypothetical protein
LSALSHGTTCDALSPARKKITPREVRDNIRSRATKKQPEGCLFVDRRTAIRQSLVGQ